MLAPSLAHALLSKDKVVAPYDELGILVNYIKSHQVISHEAVYDET